MTWTSMAKEDFFEIAKIIDPRYSEKSDQFSCQRFFGFNLLCCGDYRTACNIRLYSGMKGFTEIKRTYKENGGYKPLPPLALHTVHAFLIGKGYNSKLIEDETIKQPSAPRKQGRRK